MTKELQTGSISEYWCVKVAFVLFPPLNCLAHYVLTVGVILMFVSSGFSWRWGVYAIPLFLLGLAGLRFWYRFFFDPTYVGWEPPVEVAWSEDTIHFRGVHFDIWVHVDDVVEYKVSGFTRWNWMHTLALKVESPKGTVQAINIRDSMPDKRKFVEFLKSTRGTSEDRARLIFPVRTTEAIACATSCTRYRFRLAASFVNTPAPPGGRLTLRACCLGFGGIGGLCFFWFCGRLFGSEFIFRSISIGTDFGL